MKPYSSLLFIALLFTTTFTKAQQYVFAQLTGSPNMITTGWNLAGAAQIGDTPGDPDNFNNEMILCPPTGNNSGACFYATPLDLNICTQWTAEFDYRIYDGSGADGIAFCFLQSPPTGYVLGGGLGVPANAVGLMIALDPWNNCGGPNPELQIRHDAPGWPGYNECPSPAQPTLYSQSILRQTAYHHMKIEYNTGNISVYIDNVFYLSGTYTTNYTGYLGFTASTGGATDRHSLRNVIIYTNMPPSHAGPDASICTGDTIQIGAAGNPNFNYNWTPTTGLDNPAIANPNLTLTNSGGSPVVHTYIVHTDSAGATCSSTDTVKITVNPLPAVDAGVDATICLGDTGYIAQNGVVFGNYSWSPGADLACPTCPGTDAYPSATTNYILTLTDLHGCIASDTMTLTVATQSSVSAGPDQQLCIGDSVILNAGNASNYNWSPSTGLNCVGCQSPVANPSSTTTYTLIAANGTCTSTDSVTVFVNPLPVGIITPNSSVCNGDSLQLSISGGATYTWLPSATLTCSSCSNPIAFPSSTTTYTVTITSAQGCINTDSVTITVNPSPTANAGNDVSICAGSSTQLNGTGGGTYSWSPANSLNNGAISNPTATPATTTTYTLTVASGSCSATDQVTVTVNPNPVADAGNDQTDCSGTSAPIGGAPTATLGTGPYTYSWNPSPTLDDGTIANPTAQTNSAITYSVVVTDANGCTATDAISISIHPSPVAVAGTDQTICLSETADLTANGGATYQWIPIVGLDDPSSQNPVASPIVTTIYSVIVTDANGCGNDTATVDINVAAPPTITGDTSYTTGASEPIQLSMGGGTSYLWIPSSGLSCDDCANPMATLNETTQYTVTATDINGCSNTTKVRVIVEDLCQSVHVPNAFTPNGDGINDIFNFVNTNPENEVLEFKIFDRWGNVIYSDNSGSGKGWDGMDKFGKVYDIGAFTYYIRFKCSSGIKTVKGNVALIH